jgi:porin
MVATASAEDAAANEQTQEASDEKVQRGLLSDAPEDPGNALSAIGHRKTQKNSLFPSSGLRRFHEATDRAKENLYEKTHLKLGAAFTHLFQWLTEAPLGEDTWGTASDLDILGTWEAVNRGKPAQGQLFFQIEGRWEYGTTGPERLATLGFGSLIGSGNTFSEYKPAFLPLRNLYWQQGSEEAGWAYRVGKVTPDATLSTSAHISSIISFLPTAGTGPFANALPDSGLGIFGAWFINDRVKLLGILSDANGNRFNFGDITEGDFYKAVELGVKIAPRTEKAGYSKLALWHTDGTKDGEAANGNLGPDGWGGFLKLEQELSAKGRAIGVLRYGWSSNASAVYEQQAGAHFLLYNPTGLTRLQNDLLGVAFNWAQAEVSGARAESHLEVFYRFPILPLVDTTLSYQFFINPALDPNNDNASAFSLRLRTTF